MRNEKGDRTLRVSEVFYSIEGEGPLTGVPTVFVRLFGCNFTCSGFSNPNMAPVVLTGTGDLSKFKPTVGCDSIYAWHPKYKDTAKVYTIPELIRAILEVLPGGAVINSRSGQTPVLSFTGGEPTMHQEGIAEILRHPDMQDFDKVLIETNASLDLRPTFITALVDWEAQTTARMVLWACSPKLSNSGEAYAKAIRPTVIVSQQKIPSVQYFKFVSNGTYASFNEIVLALEDYNTTLRALTGKGLEGVGVYVMPEGASVEQQELIQRDVATKCLEHGYNFCARVHCWVYGNAIGT